MKTSLEIRQALIQIAERKGRPHYTAMVVRDVIKAIHNDLPHPLKDEVIAEKLTGFFLDSGVVHVDARKQELMVFCCRSGMQVILAQVSGVHKSFISEVMSGKRELTDKSWQRLSSAFKDAEKEFKRKRANRGIKTEGKAA